ncbi:MAG: molybdopterin-synthase adenylyltransferase MoeB [Candidatus Parabeggiatoa sp. nov. 3]|nr:MAG: molybdopterin-synthase adenylyltransferase MoeB [Gammaproteobacteria bacterium]RKZ60941.1 MAG: molybdopterin-synthase adenylyltransferase MoeB [Gammaproteobacteria bacterium]RKZ86407.1 MAG: molybdopterin-synthase adenylyltransferase MoeB [Gammaproteobacteria bacterium]HEW98347.1 molybdopterin-synthase adenylyltransferase MoeB [Beggiatoa sp.]
MDDAQLLRYSRQILLPEVGVEGQERLLNAQILIIGLGGLGSPAAMYLAAAGVGHLILSDFDVVDLSNLQRQIVHHTDDIGKPKVESARETLLALNPLIQITPLYQQLDDAALLKQVDKVDIVLDCTDNLPTRFAINQACVKTQTPLVSGAAIRMEGQISVFRSDKPESPCYRCLYPSDEALVETCTQTGILAPVVGIIGSLQALEAMKVIMDVGETLTGWLLFIDTLHNEFQRIKLVKNPKCPVCR